MNNFSLQYPLWFIVFCLLAGLVYATMLYFREQKFQEHALWKRIALYLLRFISVTGISFLLLGPLMKINSEQVKNPTIVLVQDASSSVKGDDNTARLRAIEESLSKEFQLDAYHFDGLISEGITDTLTGQTTNMSKVFEFLDETYANQNLGAVIMSTDGIFNEGQNPAYQNTNITAPFYFVAEGDTTQKKDISLKQVYHNKIAYLGDKFVVQADVQAYNFKNTNSAISIYKTAGGARTLLDKSAIQINSNDYFSTFSFEVPADQVGIVKYSIEVGGRTGEFSRSNNTREFYVDILDARQKILILANAPHPDIAALKNIITTNKNYEVTSAFAKKGVQNIANYDLVLFHNLPSKKNPVTSELALINKLKRPRIFVAGTQISIPAFNQAQNVVKITANTESTSEVQGNLKDAFKLFEQSDELKNAIGKFPPMKSMFGEYKADANASVLLTQKIGNVVTDYPLLAIRNQAGIREAVLTGEGIWNWRLFNYLQNSRFDEINELITKTIQFVTIKEDKRKFRVSASENLYKTYDRVAFDAELYNDSYEKINDVDAFLTVKNSGGKEYSYTFSKIADFYQIDAGSLPAGNYTYTGTTNYNGKSLNSKGKFSVQDVQLEQANTTADHSLLRSLTDKYGGKLFYENSAEDIVTDIKSQNTLKPIIYNSTKTESALNLKWILFLLMGLLFLEWFMRRFLGSY